MRQGHKGMNLRILTNFIKYKQMKNFFTINDLINIYFIIPFDVAILFFSKQIKSEYCL